MEIIDIIQRVEQIQQRLLVVRPDRVRPLSRAKLLREKRSALVIGPRGVGKTTLLLEAVRDQNILYISVDNPVIGQFRLWDLAEVAFGLGYDGLALDEVHLIANWSQDLKALYDSYPDKRLWASDSSSLVLRKGVADLSRRFPQITIPLLSFREYIYLREGIELPTFNPLIDSSQCEEVLNATNILALFRDYLESGFRPIFLEGDYSSKLINIIEKTIFSDVPFLLPQVQDHYLRLMNAIIGFLATSPIPTVNIESLSTEWSISKEKLYDILSALHHIGLLNIVRFKSDKKASGKGAKIFLGEPSIYHVLGGSTGNIREAFVASICRQAGLQIFASKDEQKGDFLINDILVEVGGVGKKRKKANIVIRGDVERPSRNIVPLWSLGFLY